MCTVTYLPLENGQYILTHNRDVGTQRKLATPPEIHEMGINKLIYPTDPQGGGTWNALTETHHAFILNGAEYDYHPNFDALRSRGDLCIALLTANDSYLETVDMSDYDDFTLVLVNTADRTAPLKEWKWNGKELTTREFPADEPHLWISTGLYQLDDYKRKMAAFQKLLEEIDYENPVLSLEDTAEEIWTWHSQSEVAGKEGFVIDRPYGVKTVSIFQTVKNKNEYDFRYKDMIEEKVHTYVGVEM